MKFKPFLSPLTILLVLFFGVSYSCVGQEETYFSCPSVESPPEESTNSAVCQVCDENPLYPNFDCTSATIIGNGSSFPKSSDIGPSLTGNVCMVGDFTVDEPFMFENAIVRICRGARINVATPSIFLIPEEGFIIDHSHLFSCEGLWHGIRMSSNNTVFTSRNNSKIEDAEVALQSSPFAPNIFYIENTIFNRNRIGIISVYGPILNNGTSIFVKFRGNQFTCNSPLKGTLNEYTYAGVILRNGDIIDFSNSSYTRFSDLNYGILAEASSNIGASKMIFQRIKWDGIYIDRGSLRLYDSNFFFCGEKGIEINECSKIDLKNVSFTLNASGSVPMYGVKIQNTTLNTTLKFHNITVHAASPSLTQKVGINISGVSPGTQTRIDGGGLFNIWGNYSAGIRLEGGLDPSTKTEILGNRFRSSSVGDILVQPPSAAGIDVNGNTNNLSILSNHFTGYSPALPFSVSLDRGIQIATNTTGTNNEISLNNFDDETLTLHDGIYVNGFQNMKYCSNSLTGSRENAHGFNFNGTCPGTDMTGNIMTFGDNTFSPSSIPLLIQGGTEIGLQLNKGNEWYNISSSEPLLHAKCLGIPIFNKFLTHTNQSTCTNENLLCFSKYHPRKVEPDFDNEFFDFDPLGVPEVGCAGKGGNTDELDLSIALEQYQPPLGDSAKTWVLERYLYQKMMENPSLMVGQDTFSSFVDAKENETVGKFYEVQKAIQIGVLPSENIDFLMEETLNDLDSCLLSIKSIDEQMDTILGGIELTSLYELKKGLLFQFNDLNAVLDSLNHVYQSHLSINLEDAYDLNENIITHNLYESNEKTVNHIYLTSLIYQSGKFTNNQILVLQNIAQQDPRVAGPSVHIAFGMLPDCAKPSGIQLFLDRGVSTTPASNSRVRGQNISSLPKGRQITVFPNPTSSSFKVTGLWSGDGDISLYDLQGRQLFSSIFTGSEVEVSLASTIPCGMYLIKIRMENGLNYLEKLVVHSK